MANLYKEILNQNLIITIKKILDIVIYHDYDFNFFIKFNTTNKNTVISKKILNKHPHEMVVVFKKKGEMVNFYDLNISSEAISVTLTFDNLEERLHIPFESIIIFSDQNSDFILEIDIQETKMNPEKKETKNKIIFLDSIKKK